MASIKRRTTAGGAVRYDVRFRAAADRVQTKTFRRRADAERWARRQETRKDLGELVDPRAGVVSLNEYADRWLPTRDLRPRTLRYQHAAHQRDREIADRLGEIFDQQLDGLSR